MNPALPRLTIDDVLQLVGKGGKVQRAGAGFVARCPAHEDKRASLSIGKLTNGGIGLRCHAGCNSADVAAALGIELYQLSPHKTNGASHQQNGSAAQVVATYDYTDEHGQLLFQAIRKEGKQFSQRRPDGKGGWIYRLDDVRRVPYKLPELIEGISLGRTVYICEGEKDVDNLRSLGLTATTNNGGAGKWRDEFGVFFKGANVVVLPDNDDPGRKHAELVERSLTGIASSIRVLQLPGLDEKGDVTDWLSQGGTAEKLEQLVKAAGADPDALQVPVRAIDVNADEKIDFHTTDFLVRGDIGLIVGEDGTMKTTVALHILAASVAGGKIFGRFQVERAQPAMIVSAEDSAAVIVNRLRAICRGHGWSVDRVLADIYILTLSGDDIADLKWRTHITEFVREKNIGTVVLDPMRDLTLGDENSSTELAPFIATWRGIALANNAVVLLNHHASKGAEKTKADRIRGSGAIRGASRRTLFIENRPSEDALLIESVKFSRMPNPKPFMVRRYIRVMESNHALWDSARFEYASTNEVDLDAASSFIRDLLKGGILLNSTEMREAAKTRRIGAVALSAALTTLQLAGRISFVEGSKGSKNWYWVEPVAEPVNPRDRQLTLGVENTDSGVRPCRRPLTLAGSDGVKPVLPVGQPDSLSDRHSSDPSACLSPFRGDRQRAVPEAANEELSELESSEDSTP